MQAHPFLYRKTGNGAFKEKNSDNTQPNNIRKSF
jgi:hypothetical protein